jgi:hypothetical protein
MYSDRFRSLSALVNVVLLNVWRPFSTRPGPIRPLRGKSAGFGYALNRFRPLARRRLMILRPCLVDIRFKKPWFRARRSLLG